MTRFIVVPQWQGSPSTRSMTLIDGADAIAGDLPRSATVRVDVPIEAGEALGSGIRRFSSLQRTRDLVTAALTEADGAADGASPSGHVLVVGGDCAVAVPAIEHAAALHPDMAVVWFDAHADLHTPESSASGAFAGMALRAVFETTPLSTDAAVPADRIVLAGAREFDDAETDAVKIAGLTHLGVDDLADPARLADAVAATGAGSVYVHVDLDVLDPAAITGLSAAVPFGLDVPTLTNAIGILRGRFPLAGASVSGFAPPHPEAVVDDMGSVLRVVGALA